VSRATAIVGALLVLSACAQDGCGSARRTSGAQSLAGRDSSVGESGNPGKIALSPAKLMAYLQYQRGMLQVHRELTGISGNRPRLSGKKKARPELPIDGKDAIRAMAEAEERARKENGLSSGELKAIDQMVREIIGKRVHAGAQFREDTLQRLEEMKAKLPPERRHDAEESIAQLKREQDEFSRLSEERKKYGDRNVDAILDRESELTECWKEAMALFAQTSGK
jgi:hypothetical protein